ncbi:hypothetical protein DICVIV_02819 [Dictyocaulus viviparus]|uniref:Uncharacterized protein n=1 Tax=Dictyocaulus viviparus TaxID=29172 RepID=A0A0D8Y8Q1_DICVI|nr:hypothetical protein DICVIV_02819 [Dictyocaulus viviparus]
MAFGYALHLYDLYFLDKYSHINTHGLQFSRVTLVSLTMVLAAFSSILLTCVVSQVKYKPGVNLSSNAEDDQPKRLRVRSVIHRFGRLFRRSQADDPSVINESDINGDDSLSTAIEEDNHNISDSFNLRTIPAVLVVQPLIEHRHVHHRTLPRSVPASSCGYKFGAPDGIRQEPEGLFNARDPLLNGSASYGATYILPSPACLNNNEC